MRKFSRAVLCLVALGAVWGCSQVPSPQLAASRAYRIGDTVFSIADDSVLQTWPLLPFRNPPSFARVALQLPPTALVKELNDVAGSVIQIDILAPQQTLSGDRILAAGFTDWVGREAAPAGTRYHYDPKSALLKDGGRAVYQRTAASVGGLEALEPPSPRGLAPEFFLQRAGNGVAAAIDCREVPPAYGTGEYCSLRRQIGEAYGYRVMFRRDLLPHWAEIDAAAEAYLAAAASPGT